MSYEINMNDEDYSKRAKTKAAPFEPGYYNVIVENVDIKESKRIDEHTSRPAKYFEWLMRFKDGQYAGEKIISRTTAIKGKRWLLKEALEACGVSVGEGKFKFDLEKLIGQEIAIDVEVVQESWTSAMDGKTRITPKSHVRHFYKELPTGKKPDETIPF